MVRGSSQPQLETSTMASTSAPTAMAAIGTATGSKRSWPGTPRAGSRTIRPPMMAATTNGRLMKNTARQPAQSTRIAPSVGASAPPSPAIPPHTPIAIDRRDGGNSGSSRASEAG